MITKIGTVLGSQLYENIHELEHLPTMADKVKMMQDDARDKLSEGKTSLLKAIGTGALLGGTSGLLLSATDPHTNAGATAAISLIGALSGAGAGAALKKTDDILLSQAKNINDILSGKDNHSKIKLISKLQRIGAERNQRVNNNDLAHRQALYSRLYKD